MIKDIVLIPGALATKKLWEYQEEYFKDTMRFHHLDVLNCESITEMAERFIKTAPEKFTIIGFSMGGYIGLELTQLIPDRIEKLILINSGAKRLSEKAILDRERSIDLIDQGKFDLLIKFLFKNSIYDCNNNSHLLPILQKMANQVGAKNYKKQLIAMISKPNQFPLLSKINCPTFFLAGKEDKIMPTKLSDHMATHVNGSQLLYVEGCGHMAQLENPMFVNQILSKWL